MAGRTKRCQDGDYDLGAMWECPFFVQLDQHPHDADGIANGTAHAASWVLCVSPYPHFRDNRPTNPCLYWLGEFRENRFQLGEAAGSQTLIPKP